MERETKEIITPSGAKVVVKTYLTVREFRCIEEVYLSGVKIGASGEATGSVDGTVVRKAEDELIKQGVVSVNGLTENILDTLLDMQKSDFDVILEALNGLKNEGSDEKKGQ